MQHHKSTVGASLLAKRPSHPTSMSPDTPLSRASSLPQGSCIGFNTVQHPKSTVGASLLAMRLAHPTSMSPDTPLSRASSLPQGSCIGFKYRAAPQIHCGSELARDQACPFNIHVPGIPPSRASSPPHLKLQLSPSSRQIRNTCRRSSTNWSPAITPASFCKAWRWAAER